MIGSREQQAEVRARKRSQRRFFIGLFFGALAVMVLILWAAMKTPVEPDPGKMRAAEENQMTRTVAPGTAKTPLSPERGTDAPAKK
jgi:hypothetical protein